MELYISDLHLGSPLFKSKNIILDLFDKDYDKIVIIGDLFDIWEGKIEGIVEDNIEIVDKIRSLSIVIIVFGNHDPDIDTLKLLFPDAEVCMKYYSDDRIFIHGHEFDYLVTKYSWAAKMLFPIHWVLERCNINIKNWLVRLFHSIAAKRKKKYYNSLVLDIEKAAVEKYKKYFDVIIMGHTHLPKFVDDEIMYINTGDFLHHKTYCIYDGINYVLHDLD